jgi:hypothetical protein
MCHRPVLCSIDPFNPYRPEIAPTVIRIMDMIATTHARGGDAVAEIVASSRSSGVKAYLGLALRHLGRDHGGECLDLTHRVSGRDLRGSLAQRVARRLHVRPKLLHAYMSLAMLPVPACLWGAFDSGRMDPMTTWTVLLDRLDLRQSMRSIALSGRDWNIPRRVAQLAVLRSEGDPAQVRPAENAGCGAVMTASN